MVQVMNFIDRAIRLTKKFKGESGPKLTDFKSTIEKNLNGPELTTLRQDVKQFARQFAVPAIP